MYNTEGLKFLHVNAHSLYPKLPELSLMAKDLNLDCISVNETWLNDTFSDNEIEIPDFTVFRHDRINGSHGGVALCIKTNLSPSKANLPFNTESIWVLIKINSSKLLVSSIYRTPKSPVFYHQLILQDIELASSLNIDMVIMGDLNYDYLSAAGKLKFSEIENSFLLNQVIKDRTRITLNSSTLIDHIYVSNHLKPLSYITCHTAFSDHLPVFIVLPLITSVKKSHITVRKGSYNKFNYDSFINSIINSNLNTLYTITDTLNAWKCFKNEYLYICDLHAPIRNFRVKNV